MAEHQITCTSPLAAPAILATDRPHDATQRHDALRDNRGDLDGTRTTPARGSPSGSPTKQWGRTEPGGAGRGRTHPITAEWCVRCSATLRRCQPGSAVCASWQPISLGTHPASSEVSALGTGWALLWPCLGPAGPRSRLADTICLGVIAAAPKHAEADPAEQGSSSSHSSWLQSAGLHRNRLCQRSKWNVEGPLGRCLTRDLGGHRAGHKRWG